MKLTLSEEITLNCKLNEHSSRLKPKDCCVVTIHKETEQVWCVEKFTTFRKCHKEMPWLYSDFNKFRYELHTIE